MYNYARIRLMKEYGWNRVATIHENRDMFKLVSRHYALRHQNIKLFCKRQIIDSLNIDETYLVHRFNQILTAFSDISITLSLYLYM